MRKQHKTKTCERPGTKGCKRGGSRCSTSSRKMQGGKKNKRSSAAIKRIKQEKKTREEKKNDGSNANCKRFKGEKMNRKPSASRKKTKGGRKNRKASANSSFVVVMIWLFASFCSSCCLLQKLLLLIWLPIFFLKIFFIIIFVLFCSYSLHNFTIIIPIRSGTLFIDFLFQILLDIKKNNFLELNRPDMHANS